MQLPVFPVVALLAHVLGLLSFVVAQDSPLWIQGGLESAVATDAAVYNTGGTIVINGFTMTVPKNVLVQFPAAWVPFKDFAASQQKFIGYETLVIGNTVDDMPLVAQIIVYEFFEGLSSGFIETVNFTDGSMKIKHGPTVRINDPKGVFSVGYTGNPFMTADGESPSVTAFSGFPMCIPRNSTDPLCPLSQRPSAGPGIFTARDPLVMAPLQPGDFITFSGFREGNEVVATTIVAQNVQILTIGDIVYVRMELARIGIDNPSPNADAADSRLLGFVTNNRALVKLYAMDVDPCTGIVTDRMLANVPLRGGRNEQNLFRWDTPILSGYVREYRAVANIGNVPKTRLTKNGIMSGQAVQPVNVWIQAEQLVPGTPPVPFDFSQMAFLTAGVGRDENGNIWGPLDPFPQSGMLIDAPVCPAP